MTRSLKLGKKAARYDIRTLKFAKYRVGPALPPPPAFASWVTDVPSWPLLANDSLGDCVIAAMGHMEQAWAFYVAEKLKYGQPFIPTDAEAITAYEAVGGYDPRDPATDNGCDMLTALRYWRRVGFAGRKIFAYMQVDPKNDQEWQDAIALFGNLYIGLNLPVSVQDKAVWTVPDGGPVGAGARGSWGGHSVNVQSYSDKSLTCITWGQPLKMSHNFFKMYCDEAYAVLSPHWFNNNQVSPSSFNVDQLKADLAAL